MERLEIRTRTYVRPRDARMALIRCLGCGDYYETSARQARRIRTGETRRLCKDCRPLGFNPEAVAEREAEFVQWWLEDSGLTREELVAVAVAVMAFLPKEARRSESETSPNRRHERAPSHNDRTVLALISSSSSNSSYGRTILVRAGTGSHNSQAQLGAPVLRQPQLDAGEAA